MAGMSAKAKEVLQVIHGIGIGLSSVIRYGFAGFVFLALVAALDPTWTEVRVNSLGTGLTALTAFIVGAGIYATHRSIVIPFHHLLLISAMFVSGHSASPTRVLNKWDVRPGRRMIGYSVLRRSLFPDRDQRDVAHAENGLVVMIAEVLLVAGLYASSSDDTGSASRALWLILAAAVFFVSSYPRAWLQHTEEACYICANEEEAKKILKSHGLLSASCEAGGNDDTENT